jgi:two-component system, probable response regulator PhcQ
MTQTTNNLLIVDDELPIVRSLQRLVRQHFGGRVVCWITDSAQQALTWAHERPFDAMISDLCMPEMDGLKLLGQVAAIQPHAALLLLTGAADFSSAQRAVNQVGVFRYLTKPWHDAELLAHVEAAIAHGAEARSRAADADAWEQLNGQLSPQEAERRRLEALEPGITVVEWGPGGEVLMPPIGN